MAGAHGPIAGVLALRRLRETDITWRLLRSDHAELVAGLLSTHLGGETRRMQVEDLTELVDTDLDTLRGHGADLPRTAQEYLREWRAAGYLLRRPSDDARGETLELSPEALAAIHTLDSLAEPRSTVTESRLASIAAQVRRLAIEVDPDIERRLAALRADRAQLDERIARLETGDIESPDPGRVTEAVRDVLQQAQEMPADFGRLRARFEALNRELRERIVQADDADRHVLDDVFRGVDVIADSEEGRSFAAFTALVLDPATASALEEDLDLLLASDGGRALSATDRRFLARFLATLKDQGREIEGVVTAFARGLRRYVQTREFQREQALRRLLQQALGAGIDAAKHVKPYRELGLELPLSALTVRSAGALALYQPDEVDASAAVPDRPSASVDLAALRAIARETEVDWDELRGAVADVLGKHGSASVAEVIALHPATQGVASVAGLVTLAGDQGAPPDGSEDVAWCGLDAVERQARIPRLVFREVPA